MANELTATFGKPFKEAVAAFRLRLGNLVPTARWDDLWQEQHDRAFMVAGATKADLLADLAAAVEKAIAQGTSLEEFRRDFRKIVEERGWHGWTGEGTKAGEAWRTRVIYRTNMRVSYAAGRMAQLVEGGFTLWVYRHGGSVEPRIIHLGWDGLVLPPEHPFWATHAPPNGWGCSCYVVGADSFEGAQDLGGQPGKKLPDGWQKLDPKTGAPVGIDKGWAYAPGRSAANDIIAAVTGKVAAQPAEIGAALMDNVLANPDPLGRLVADFGDFVDRALSSMVERNFMIVGALKPNWVAAAKAAGAAPQSAEIAVTDLSVQHAFRGTPNVTAVGRPSTRAAKVAPLDLDWYKDLPRHLMQPRAVLLDTSQRTPAFILVYDVPGAVAKLVVKVDTPVKKAGGVLNVLQSGRLLEERAIRALIGQGAQVIEGEV